MPLNDGTELTEKRCVPCEGGVPVMTAAVIGDYLQAVPHWRLTEDGTAIQRRYRMKDFVAALDFFAHIGRIAEEENHHPDLHLTDYRSVAIVISTHAVGGLTENDFILAAKIDRLPFVLKA